MDKLKMHSVDKTQENIGQIRALFPNCVTEARNGRGETTLAVDFDMLRQELSDVVVDGPKERYQFTWPDKRRSVLEANAPIAKTLRPCRGESVGFDTTENLYIEGDNLDVLKLLQEAYLGGVRMIYIDPPYNTGKDFVYHDDFSQSVGEYMTRSGDYDEEGGRLVQNLESNGRFHTDWLNMMYPRLKAAKSLLSEEGVILINIDENEVVNLQKLCAEIYGPQNDLGTIVWDKRNPKGDARGVSQQHEYIIIYAKNKDRFFSSCSMRRPKANAQAILKKAAALFSKRSSDYALDDINRDFASWMSRQRDFSAGEQAYNKIDENGDVYRPVSMAWPNRKKAPDDYFVPLIHPVTKKPCPVPSMGWRNPSRTMLDLQEKGRILFGADETTQPNRKYLLKENLYENIPSLLYNGGSDTDLLKSMGIPFDTPKMVSICKEHISSFTSMDDTVLDFFSGSATTAHAVMRLNAEDGGHRKFIMVQIPEETGEKSEAYKAGYRNICEIGKERIRRAGAKIKEENPLTTQNLDVGFRVLKVDSTNMRDVYYNPAAIRQSDLLALTDNIKPDRTAEDLLFQIMLDLGVPLSSKIDRTTIGGKTVYSVADDHLLACFDDGVTDEVITGIAKRKPNYFVMRDSALSGDAAAANFEQIFQTYSPATERKVL